MDNTEDNKPQKKDITKTVKFKLRRVSSPVDDKKTELEMKPKHSSSESKSTSRQMPKKTVVMGRRKNGMNTKSSVSVELPTRTTFSETKKTDTNNSQIEKTIELNRKKTSPTVDSEISEKQALKLKGIKPQSEISKTQTLKLRVPKTKSSPKAVSLVKQTDKAESIDSATSNKDTALFPPPLSEQSSISGDSGKNTEISPLQVKKTFRTKRGKRKSVIGR